MTLSAYEAKEVQMLRNQLLFKEDPLDAQVKEGLIRKIGSRLGSPEGMKFSIGDLVIHTTRKGYDHLAVIAGYLPVQIANESDVWEWGYSIILYSQGNPTFEARNRRYGSWPDSVRKATEKDIVGQISGSDVMQKLFGRGGQTSHKLHP